jgi:hypothetical protein
MLLHLWQYTYTLYNNAVHTLYTPLYHALSFLACIVYLACLVVLLDVLSCLVFVMPYETCVLQKCYWVF